MIKMPGGSWEKASYKIVRTAASNGSLVGSFADQDGLYTDNEGYMFVRVREL